LRSEAVVVLDGKPPLQKVFALNDKARHAGAEPGMTKLQLEAAGGLTLRARSELQEAAAHAALLDCAQSFSPRVEDTAADTIVLDVAGLESLFGPLPKLARDIARRASDMGLEANVAVASNIDAAIIAARGFSGVTVIAPGKEAEQLGGLPVQVLFTDAEEEEAEQLLETFERWGIRTLRALAALPEIALSERLGQRGVHLHQLARGTVSRTLVAYEAPPVFEEAIELEHPVVLLEPLAFLLGRLLDQICNRLAARALSTQELRLELELAQGWSEDVAAHHSSIFRRTLRLPVPLLDTRIFLKLLQLDLKSHPPGAPIIKIRLAAEPVRPRAAQAGLFMPPSPEPEKLELTLARISGIVGEGNIGCAELLDTHRPEGFRMQRFAVAAVTPAPALSKVEGARRQTREPVANSVRTNGVVTALRIFRPPLHATVTMREGTPVRVVCPKRKEVQGEIVWTAGPWRSSGDWWDQEGWSRDEWDIAMQTDSGLALYRLIRDLLSGKWFVEGIYD